MVLRIYVVLLLVGMVGLLVSAIFDSEKEKRRFASKKYLECLDKILNIFNKLGWAYFIAIVLYNIFVLIYCIIANHHFFMIMPLLFILGLIFAAINQKCDFFDFLTNGIACVCFALWLIFTVLFCMFVIDTPINEESITENVELVQTINILEFKQAPYNSITGGRYYIKSSPDSAYYYEVATENGGTTTKVIDGSANYVEKYESDEYAENPHIEVYRVSKISQYTTWYGNNVTKEKSSHYNYYIYTPVNSMFYEE